MYYLRSKAATDPIKFTLGQKHQQKFVANAAVAPEAAVSVPADVKQAPKMEALDVSALQGKVCSLDDPTCEACSA